MVSVVVAMDAPGVIDCGEKLQVAFSGRPEQLNCTAVLNPPAGWSEIVAVPVWPCWMVRFVLLEEILNDGGPVIVTLTLFEVDRGKKALPAKTAWIELAPAGRLFAARVADPPELMAPLPIATPFDVKLTVPEGVPWEAVTRAVRVTAVPTVAVARDAERTVTVLTAETLTIVAEELAEV